MPSGFVPIEVGSVRERTIAEIYREGPLLLALRDPKKLEGGCGLCPWREPRGGSRARACAATGNPLVPAALVRDGAAGSQGTFGRTDKA